MAVHGVSGSGKTTLAREIACRLAVPALELDALYHQENWSPLEEREFRQRVQDFVSKPAWVCDGNYHAVRDLVWERAQVIVLLDLPRPLVMARLLRRTLRRLAWREVLWNENREAWRNLFSRDPERNVLLWSWRTYESRRVEIPRDAARLAPHAALFRVRNRRDRRSLLALLGAN